jgi:hypothetical protein
MMHHAPVHHHHGPITHGPVIHPGPAPFHPIHGVGMPNPFSGGVYHPPPVHHGHLIGSSGPGAPHIMATPFSGDLSAHGGVTGHGGWNTGVSGGISVPVYHPAPGVSVDAGVHGGVECGAGPQGGSHCSGNVGGNITIHF